MASTTLQNPILTMVVATTVGQDLVLTILHTNAECLQIPHMIACNLQKLE